MEAPVIFDIQKFSVHDGPGIRTTVFFKGCPLRCAWCHNPESQSFAPELMFDFQKCTGCGLCARECPTGAAWVGPKGEACTDPIACVRCGRCADVCPQGARELVGGPEAQMTVCDLMSRLLEDRPFYDRSGGGVTLSGGECMVQDPDYLEELCRALKEEGVDVAVDTCGHAPRETFERLLPWVDRWLYDIKLLDPCEHERWCGCTNELILANLDFLASSGANINVRIPTIGMVNASDAFMCSVMEYLDAHVGRVRVSLLPYHATGSGKYARLGRPYPAERFSVPSDGQMEHFRSLFRAKGFEDVHIGG